MHGEITEVIVFSLNLGGAVVKHYRKYTVGYVSLRDLPYLSGRPLSLIRGEEIGDTALADYITTHSTLDRQVYVSLHREGSALGSRV